MLRTSRRTMIASRSRGCPWSARLLASVLARGLLGALRRYSAPLINKRDPTQHSRFCVYKAAQFFRFKHRICTVRLSGKPGFRESRMAYHLLLTQQDIDD